MPPPQAPSIPPVGEPVLAPQDDASHPLAPWFDYFRGTLRYEREERAEQGRTPTRPQRRALITIVHNEPVFLPIFLRYYGQFFAPEDIYVLDNETTDGSTGGDGFVRIPVEHDTVDHVWMARTIEKLQQELIERYDVTVVCDVDELIAPVPEVGDLGAYLDYFDDEWVNCLGYELIHMRNEEPAIDLGRPILEQRRFWSQNDGYSKAAIGTGPMTWVPGFHHRADYQMKLDPDLRMIHLHRMDYDLCLERHIVRSRKAWAGEDADSSWAVHNQIVDPDAFEQWFYEESSFDNYPVRAEPMRPNWRGVF